MAPFTALLTLELQAPLAIQKLRRATERLAVRQRHLAVKIEYVPALRPGKTCQLRMLCLS